MFNTKCFPSLFEASTAELIEVAEDLETGLKIQIEGRSYIVGELALREGTSPHKDINSAPSDLDYRLLLQAALAIAQPDPERSLTVVTGFPYTSYAAYREAAENLIQGNHVIRYDGQPFGSKADSVMEVAVNDVGVLPEIEGVITAVRNGELQETDPFFAVSLGYGTFEAVLSLPSGPVQRTATSGHGLRFATRRMIERLQREHNLGMLTEHQIDMAIQKGAIIVDHRRVDLLDLRREALQLYYDDVISPALKKAFTGSDLGRAHMMYIAGGGAHYDGLTNAFENEFGDILDVQVTPTPDTCVSRGFALAAEEISGASQQRAVGLDLGNANTVVALPQEDDPTPEVEKVLGEEASLEGNHLSTEGDAASQRKASSERKPLFANKEA